MGEIDDDSAEWKNLGSLDGVLRELKDVSGYLRILYALDPEADLDHGLNIADGLLWAAPSIATLWQQNPIRSDDGWSFSPLYSSNASGLNKKDLVNICEAACPTSAQNSWMQWVCYSDLAG
jgi:hypothetical protein